MERVELTRDVDTVEIPAGHALVLRKGTEVFITRSLNGGYVLRVPPYGARFRIEAKDADAIGKEVTTTPGAPTEGGEDLERQAWDQLKSSHMSVLRRRKRPPTR